MLLRHFIQTQTHLPRISISASASRAFRTDGPRRSEPSHNYPFASASATTNTAAVEHESIDVEIPLFAHRDKSKEPAKPKIRPVNLPVPVLSSRAIREQLKTGYPVSIESAAQNILKSSRMSFKQSLWDLLVQEQVLRKITLETLQEVLYFTEANDMRLGALATECILRRLLSLRQKEDIRPFLPLIHPHLLNHLEFLRPANLHSVSYTPPEVIKLSFIFVHDLLHNDDIDEQRKALAVEDALVIFRSLVKSGHIPSEAMLDSSSSQTSEQVIDMSLLRASMYWNLYDVSEAIVSDVLRSPTPIDSFTLRHSIDCLYTLLTSPSPAILKRCLNIIRLLHFHSPVPDSLIRQFYDCAVDVDAMSVAEKLYDFSRSMQVLPVHQYPPPQGRALSKLMFHLADTSGNVHLVRTLASEVVEGQLTIPLNDRARFIAAIASKGISSTSRALWERFASAKGGSLVFADSGLLVQLVNLFTNLTQSLKSRATGPEEGDVDDEKMSRASDTQSFVHQVMSKFKKHHEPWENADHRMITSYARACFKVGKNTEGFEVLKVLLGRLELPDLHDVNVALSAIAKESPSAAARTIKKMEEQGLHPDIVTYGTVLHYAAAQECQDVASEMMKQILALESLQSDVKVFGALIRALVKPTPEDDKETSILKLRTAWKIIHEVGVPQPSTQIGNYLVSLAIEAKDASLAFKFWSALLKGSAEYDDHQQRSQRIAIIVLARAQTTRDEMSKAYYQLISRELNRQENS
ncbi:hypothetical protein NP233_g7907 [Leucocoprinus birnbaumii]|uniref:Pentatricopeptide repeat-containing protein n=1 Tax=Leucocoprinus birnbaumii TaxID=56174 RepID=A0AAD5VQ03_9AGAR|nr:hypothetical protein NP233_g7907 [Leucocoprinus birnbaumii]